MRPIEILLLIANLLAFFGLTLPRLHALSAMRFLPMAALVIAITQFVIEGPRWQMIPAYALAIIFFVIWLLGMILPDGIPINRIVCILSAGVGILVLIIAAALPLLLPVFHFPKPTGPYAIGTLTYHWVDMSRPEFFTPDPNDHRELMVQVWYPAQPDPSARRSFYVQDGDAVATGLAHVTRFPALLFTNFIYVQTNAVEFAPILDNAGKPSSYPVLIYLTGLGGFRSASTFQIEELVSYGYIVVGIDQPGAVAMVSFPDGRQIVGWSKEEISPLTMQSIEPQPTAPTLSGKAFPEGILPYFAQDVSFTLDQLALVNTADPNQILTGHLNLDRIGTFGISLGGENAAEACLRDARLKACLIMDVWMPADVVQSSLQQPTMFITRDAATMRLERERSGGWTEKDIALTLDTMRAVYQNLPKDGYYLEIPSIFHINFTDAPYWSPVMSQIGLTGPIDGQRGFDILNAYSLAFFDRYLKGQPSPLLDGPSHQYPEVNIQIQTHRR